MPSPDAEHDQVHWEHAHRCPQCGHVVKSDDIPYEAIVAGIITCVNCGWSGPINIDIIPEDTDSV